MTDKIVHLGTEWADTRDAAARLGIHRRTLQRRARAGRIETRTIEDGRVQYRLTPDAFDDGERHGATTPSRHSDTGPGTPWQGGATPATDALRAEIAYLRAALVDAERRAAVAEYRAELAETERDAARDRVRALRTGTIARLARRVAELTQGG
jgi:hypothetical protein